MSDLKLFRITNGSAQELKGNKSGAGDEMTSPAPALAYSAGRYADHLYSMRQWHAMTPLGIHYDDVLNSAEAEGVDEDSEVWRFECSAVSVIDTFQVITDQADSVGAGLIEKFRKLHAENVLVPPIVLEHVEVEPRGELFLIDGRHRYNAALKDGREEICAWVLHAACSCLSNDEE